MATAAHLPNKSIERVTIVTMSPKSLAKQMVILMTQERSPAQVLAPKTCRQISPQCFLYVPHLISKHKSGESENNFGDVKKR